MGTCPEVLNFEIHRIKYSASREQPLNLIPPLKEAISYLAFNTCVQGANAFKLNIPVPSDNLICEFSGASAPGCDCLDSLLLVNELPRIVANCSCFSKSPKL